MNYRRRVERQIVDDVFSNTPTGEACVAVFLQKRPYTAVQLEYWYVGKFYCAIGFSKVMLPDRWDAEEGKRIAIKRAARDISHQICAEFPEAMVIPA